MASFRIHSPAQQALATFSEWKNVTSSDRPIRHCSIGPNVPKFSPSNQDVYRIYHVPGHVMSTTARDPYSISSLPGPVSVMISAYVLSIWRMQAKCACAAGREEGFYTIEYRDWRCIIAPMDYQCFDKE